MYTAYTDFVKKNINKMPQNSPKERMKAVAKLWRSQGKSKLTFRMKDGDSLYDVLVEYMEKNYEQGIGFCEDLRFTDNTGRKIFVQLKWFGGDRRYNGELIVKVIKIEPKGGNVLTKAVEALVQHPDVNKWGLNKVVLESIQDKELFVKLQKRGWATRPGMYSNLYWNAPGYKEPNFSDLFI
jgi:hypothetical protein